jgi:hypothetical protein
MAAVTVAFKATAGLVPRAYGVSQDWARGVSENTVSQHAGGIACGKRPRAGYEWPINTPARNTKPPPTTTCRTENQKFIWKYRYRISAIAINSIPTTA